MVCLDNIAPIGSIIGCDNDSFVVISHRMTRDGAQMGVGYLCVPYPLGFVDQNSLLMIPASRVDSLIHEGFANEAGSQYLAQLEAVAQEVVGLPYHEYADSVLLLRGLAQEGDADAS